MGRKSKIRTGREDKREESKIEEYKVRERQVWIEGLTLHVRDRDRDRKRENGRC